MFVVTYCSRVNEVVFGNTRAGAARVHHSLSHHCRHCKLIERPAVLPQWLVIALKDEKLPDVKDSILPASCKVLFLGVEQATKADQCPGLSAATSIAEGGLR